MHFLQIVWDPKSEGIPIFGDFKIHYYSMMWMATFILGYYIMKKIFKREGETQEKLDALFIYSVISIMLGARLGHVIFYEPELFKKDFFSIFLPFRFNPTFEFTGFRGLASHGATIGMIIAMYIYKNKHLPKRTWLWIVDRVAVPASIGIILIRLGNFFNSEMIGKEADASLPWGVVFKKIDNVVRHPGQLYEAFGYLFIFIIMLYLYWKTDKRNQPGFLFGSFFAMLWSVRLFVEQFKIEQVDGREDWILGMNTGQVLSIPLIIVGLYFMFIYKPKTSV